ncbi:MAG: hypothetical protein K5768_08865 [Firmicutes bacterium]|nr:hypothetical protein [Bacillota bacterium]
MSLYSVSALPNAFFVSVLNSNLIFDYYREFINCTVNIQINDLRQIPIIIPNEKELDIIMTLFEEIYSLKKQDFSSKSDTKSFELIESDLDVAINLLYGIDI